MKDWVLLACAAAGLALCLLGGTAPAQEVPVWGQGLAEWTASIHDPATHWLAAFCLLTNALTLTALRARFAREWRWVWGNAECWLALAWSAARYAFGYPQSGSASDFLLLLAVLALGQGAAAWAAWARTARTPSRGVLAATETSQLSIS